MTNAPPASPASSRPVPSQPRTVQTSPSPPARRSVRTGRQTGWLSALLILLLGAAAGGVLYYFYFRTTPVATVTVIRGNVVRAFYATGVVRPDFEYLIKSKTQGALTELNVREGQLVKTGQVLARVDDKQLRFAVEKAQAEFNEAQAQVGDLAPQQLELQSKLKEARDQLAISTAELTRVLDTFNKGVGTVTDVDATRRGHVQWSQAVATLESQLGTWKIESQRRLDVAAANLRRAQADLADTEVRAPIAGIVLERYIEAGQVVGLNERLFLVADPADKLMKAKVDEEDIARTSIGQQVFMQLYAFNSQDPDNPTKPFEGRVREILPTADPVNKTFEVKVAFLDPPPQLRVGMTAEINFIEGDAATPPSAASTATTRPTRRTALVVPATAVMDGKIYRVQAGKYVPIEVKVGVKSLEKYEVTGSGGGEGGDLKEGDTIVADAKQVAPIKLPAATKASVPTRIGDKPTE